MERLIVVGAPAGAGKTAFLQPLLEGTSPLAATLGLGPHTQWISSRSLRHFGRRAPRGRTAWPDDPPRDEAALEPLSESVVLEYNTRRLERRAHEPVVELLHDAKRLVFVTLWTPPERLLRQRLSRELGGPGNDRDRLWLHRLQTLSHVLPRNGLGRLLRGALVRRTRARLSRKGRRLLRLQLEFYERPELVVDNYRRWLSWCDGFAAKTERHAIVECDESPTEHSRLEWERIAALAEARGRDQRRRRAVAKAARPRESSSAVPGSGANTKLSAAPESAK